MDSPFENPKTSLAFLKSGFEINAPLPVLNLTYAIEPLKPGNCWSFPT